jgi:pilus assembly protein Flp/PilA
MQQVLAIVGRLVKQDEGQDLLEYGLLVVLIAIVALGAVMTVGNTINAIFWNNIAQNF